MQRPESPGPPVGLDTGVPATGTAGRVRVDAERRHAAGPPADLEPGTLAEIYMRPVRECPRPDAWLRRAPDGTWTPVSREAVAERVRRVALAFRALGYERGDRVAILCHTRPEWAVCDFAFIMSGIVSVPVYPTLPADQVAHILADARARAVVAGDREQAAKVYGVHADLPELERVILVEESGGSERRGSPPVETVALGELEARGARVPDELAATYESHAGATSPEDLATLIYTSGTTGAPKGVMLTHANLHSNVILSQRVLPVREDDLALSWLPLSHVFERTAGHYIMWHAGASIAYAEDVDTIARDLGEVRPTLLTGIPRLYEKLQARAGAAAREGGRLRERIFEWAMGVGREWVEVREDGGDPGPWLGLRRSVADHLVFRKLRKRVGGRLRCLVSGGAPLSTSVAYFLHGAGLPVLEGYGLTETSPVLAINPPDAVRIGTVGPPIPGTELRIADDGEILARGRQVMRGYLNDDEATGEALDEAGWFRTGDIGSLDEAGYLRITDRKKEIIVTSGGKNIAPAPIEKALARSSLVEHAVMIGDRRRFPMVVVVPEPDALRSWCRKQGMEVDDAGRAELLERPGVREMLEAEVLEQVREFAHYERPKKVLAVPGPFTVEGGELTPTQKVKRRVVAERFAEEIDRVYREAEAHEPGEEGST